MGVVMAPPLLPITRLVACPSCQEHVKSNERVCPHCDTSLGTIGGAVGRAAAAVLMGLALASCNGKDDPEPEYGVPVTESSASNSESATDATTGTASEGSSSTAGTGTATGSTGTTGSTTIEPDYGVPTTTAEPEYGVPTTDGSTVTGEPEYGVPDTTTEPEPDYGVPDTA